MPIFKRFNASNEVIAQDLGATALRMERSFGWTIRLGGRASKAFMLVFKKSGVAVEDQQADLYPNCAGVRFARRNLQGTEQRYDFVCRKYGREIDNLRASQLAVTLTYRVFEDYAVNQGEDGEDAFARHFTPFMLQLTSGKRAWWEVFGLEQNATHAEVVAMYRVLQRRYHPDNQATGDAAKSAELNRAFREYTTPSE